jgi:glycosyltransferase involved in cell wall biosynthesis
MLGAKIILDIHDIVPEFYAAKFNAGKSNLITRALSLIERSCCSFAHHVIISNDLWYETLISRSVDKSKCTVFLNYPDTSIFSRIEIEGEYKEGPFTIIYPGSLNYHQGVDISVKAMEKVRRVAPDVRFDIYGFGPMKSSLAKMIQSLHLQDTVFLYEPLSLEGIAKKMATAQL